MPDLSDQTASANVDSVNRNCGVVAIGRNEGERLIRCLKSLLPFTRAIVYVDSGSTDNSLQAARDLGVETVSLDMTLPFTAARARNAGLARLLELYPHLEQIQFVDGDCEIAEGWLEKAYETLKNRADVAVVCGRRRERHPEQSRYNLLCDLEWDTPVGEAMACGGDALFRRTPLLEVGGYNDSLIAGEEPELCARLRAKGWKILRIDAEMTLHDAAMTRFRQWWRRAYRAGHAYAEVSRLRSLEHDSMWTRQVRSNWFWGLVLPLVILGAAVLFPWALLLLPLSYLFLGWRIYRSRQRLGDSKKIARLFATYCVIAKMPLVLGQLHYHLGRLSSRPPRIIEYKGNAS